MLPHPRFHHRVFLRSAPTLVVGYSVKSQGIGDDLGMVQWVLPIGDSGELGAFTTALWEERTNVRVTLQKRREEILQQYINAESKFKSARTFWAI